MPNWCSNMLQVSGEKKSLENFLEKYGKFTFSLVRPIPSDFVGVHSGFNKIDGKEYTHWRYITLDNGEEKAVGISAEELSAWNEKWGASGWYDWCIANWGTKWDIQPSPFEEEGSGIYQISFDTAWAPPTPIVFALAQEFPSLNFEHYYAEPGCAFAGLDSYADGDMSDQNYIEDNFEEMRGISGWHDAQFSYLDDEEEFEEESSEA